MRLGIALLGLCAGCRLGFDPRVTGDGGASSDGRSQTTGDARGDGNGSSGACMPTYTTTIGTSRYRIAGTDQWLNSQLDCASDGSGSHLVVVDTATEMNALIALAGTQRAWVGVSDRVALGTWRLVTGPTATFLPWQAGSPSTSAAACVSWDPTTGTFRDETCGIAYNRICECDGTAADPTAY